MFGRKRIAELEQRIVGLETQLKNTCNDHNNEVNRLICEHNRVITKLVRDLREMDQLVYQMAQTVEQSVARSALCRTWAITEKRMQAESKRIQDILIPEIKATYADHTPQQPLSPPDTRRLTKG